MLKKLLLTAITLIAVTLTSYSKEYWSPDTVLGDGFQVHQFDMGEDYSGPVASTLIRHLSKCDNDSVGILYIHGYNDYFFQKEEAIRFADSCYSFYAVDLRKYGRSILPGQTPTQARSLREYFPDIDSALMVMRRDGISKVALMGHSTGGLITSYFMTEQPDSMVRCLILNSPFLEWNMNGFMRNFAIPVVSFLGKFFPNWKISQGNGGGYAQSLLKQYHGEWEFNTEWKTIHPRKVEASWIRAIDRAQSAVRHKKITVPILLMHSSQSVSGSAWTPEMQRGDAVLNVKDMEKYGPMLGTNVTLYQVPGGLHDLFLSSPDARNAAYTEMFTFLRLHGM